MGKANRAPALRLMAWLLAILVLAGCTPQWGRNNGGGQARAGHLLIAEVYPNGFVGDGSDAYIRLHNPTDAAVSLAGWSVGDAKARATFPAGAQIGAQQSLYIARTEAGFRKLFGAPPGYVWGGGGSTAAPAMNGGAAFKPGAQVGAVILRDGTGAPVDTVVWGAPPEAGVTGWKGQPAAAPFKGIVLDRSRDEAAWTAAAPGPYARDTDSGADWKQGGHWLDLRVLRPGQTWFGYPTYTVSGVTAYASPDSTYQVLTDLLNRARRSIDLNIYDFQLAPVAEKLAAAARRGVTVRVLIEAQSSQKLDDQERYVAKLITAGGGQVRWIVNDPGRGINGRYVYDHAKYIVVDGRTTLVQSENIGKNGTPPDPTTGNRGWGAVLEDQALSAYMARVFEADWSPAYGDVFAYQEGTPFGGPAPGFVPDNAIPSGTYLHPFPPLVVREPVQVTPVLAPDHSLLESKGVIGLMRGARESLLIEQQYVQVYCDKFPTNVVAARRLFSCPFDPFRLWSQGSRSRQREFIRQR